MLLFKKRIGNQDKSKKKNEVSHCISVSNTYICLYFVKTGKEIFYNH